MSIFDQEFIGPLAPLTPQRFVKLLNYINEEHEKQPPGLVSHWRDSCSLCRSGAHTPDVTEAEVAEIGALANYVDALNRIK